AVPHDHPDRASRPVQVDPAEDVRAASPRLVELLDVPELDHLASVEVPGSRSARAERARAYRDHRRAPGASGRPFPRHAPKKPPYSADDSQICCREARYTVERKTDPPRSPQVPTSEETIGLQEDAAVPRPDARRGPPGSGQRASRIGHGQGRGLTPVRFRATSPRRPSRHVASGVNRNAPVLTPRPDTGERHAARRRNTRQWTSRTPTTGPTPAIRSRP